MKWLKMSVLMTFFVCGLLSLGAADIVVGPLTIVIDAAPGEMGSGYFRVVNDGETPEEVTVSLGDWFLDPQGNTQFAALGSLERSLAEWLELTPVTFQLEPGQVQRVDFTIDVPSGVSGDHWALLFVEGSEVTPIAETTGELQTRIGAKVRYGVKVFQRDPGATKAGRIVGMELLSTEPLKIRVAFANTGDAVLWNVTGRVEIRDDTGATVRTLEMEEFTVLPGGERELILEDEGERLAAGDYIALVIIDFGGDYLVGHQLQFKI